MSDKYRKTSAEELTAMADELRAIGPFEEDEKFIFPNAENTTPEIIPTKLIPKFGSTTVIERDGVCESWVRLPETDWPYGVTSFSRSNYNSYRDNTSEEPEVLTYYIYGLKESLNQGQEINNGETVIYNDLDDYIEVLNGYYTFIPAISGAVYVGTGSIIEVYNENNELIEKFIIVIYGDLDGNGVINNTDVRIAEQEISEGEWSDPTKASYKSYLVKAADLNRSGEFENTDVRLFNEVINAEKSINQISGIAESEITLYSFYITNTIGQLGFAEAYKETSTYFYQKIIHATLTQEDIEGLILDDPDIDIFRDVDSGVFSTFPDITQITVTAKWLNHNFNAERLSNLQEVIVFDPENVTSIASFTFETNDTLTTIKCSPTSIKHHAFFMCDNLIIGPDYLNIENCTSIGDYALTGISQTDSLSLPKITYIGASTFYIQNLSKLYLPDIPPRLYSGSGVFSNDIIFYVSTNDVLTTYSTAENWSYLYNNNRIKSLEAEAISNGSNQS